MRLTVIHTAATTYVLAVASLTWNPPFICSPNQMCLRSLFLLDHQFLRGMLVLEWTQDSPVSMLQKTLIASMVHPWLGSIQYSPARGKKAKKYLTSATGMRYFYIFVSIQLNLERYIKCALTSTGQPSFPPIWPIPHAATHRSSSQGGRASGPCRCELGSSWIPRGCGCFQSGCWGTWAWRRLQHRADGGFRRPGQPSCTWEDQGPFLCDSAQQRQTCQYQDQGGQEDQGVRGFLGVPDRKRKKMQHFSLAPHFILDILFLFVDLCRLFSRSQMVRYSFFSLLRSDNGCRKCCHLFCNLFSCFSSVHFWTDSLFTRYKKSSSEAIWSPLKWIWLF